MGRFVKPGWWRWGVWSYWLILIVLPAVIAGLILFFSRFYNLFELVKYFIVTFFFIGSAYYLRKVYSLRVWKGIWVMLGIGLAGFPTAVASAIILIKYLGLPWFISLPISFIMAIIIGGYIGSYIGRRRGYIPLG